MNISPLAVVSADAKVGPGATIDPFTIIHGGVILEPGVTIGAHCEIGVPTPLAKTQRLIIGSRSVIRSHSVFYIGSEFGPHLVTGHHVVVRENIRAGRNLQVGTFGDLQGDTTFGEYVRLHSSVLVAKDARIGNYIWIMPRVTITNDPHPPSNVRLGVTVEDFAVIATNSVILPGITISRGAVVSAGSVVTADVPADCVVAGSPAKLRGPTSQVKLRDGTDRSAYPWFRHFERGYPAETVRQWRKNAGLAE